MDHCLKKKGLFRLEAVDINYLPNDIACAFMFLGDCWIWMHLQLQFMLIILMAKPGNKH